MYTHRRFHLVRDADVSGISGVGVVAEGVQFSDGTVVMRWLRVPPAGLPSPVTPTTVIHDDIESVVAIHGHVGATWVRWADAEIVRPET